MPLSPRPAAVVAAVVATTCVVPLLAVAPAAADHKPQRVTDYAFAGGGFGSRASAAQVGSRSDRSAFVYLGCTRRTGVHRRNVVAEAGVGTDALLVSGVANTTASYRGKRRLGTRTVSSVTRVVLGDPDGQHLTVHGLRTVSNAFARRSDGTLGATSRSRTAGVEAATGTALDTLINQVDGGLEDAIAAIGDPLVIPNFGTITLGHHRTAVRKRSARARGSAFDVRLYGADGAAGGGDDVTIVLGRAGATIFEEVPAGVMRGRAVPLEARAVDGVLDVGRVNDHPLPCPGTRGEIRRKATAAIDVGGVGQVVADGLRTRVFGVQRRTGAARAWTEATVSGVSLAGGEILLEGVVGRVNVRTNRRGAVVGRNTRGSTIGRVVVQGEEHALPGPGDVIEVPDVATLEFFDVTKQRRGLSVTAVRVTLLPGTPGESVVELGRAGGYIKRS